MSETITAIPITIKKRKKRKSISQLVSRIPRWHPDVFLVSGDPTDPADLTDRPKTAVGFWGLLLASGAQNLPAMSEIWCNGQWQAADGVMGAALDRGGLVGLGLFETMLALDGRAVFLERHIARLQRSGERFGWSLELEGFQRIGAELLVRNGLAKGRARLRLTVTAGSGPLDDLTPGADRQVWLAALPLTAGPDSIKLGLSPWRRHESSALAGLKSASYAENLVALDEARRRGFQETLFLNTADEVCEAATANIFLVKNGTVLTPPLASGCLPGVGREVICELAQRHGLVCEQRTLTLANVTAADEIFLTSALRGPVAVTCFEDHPSSPAPTCEVLRQLWLAEIRR
jgi:branched-chain amino acid aminotransferase